VPRLKLPRLAKPKLTLPALKAPRLAMPKFSMSNLAATKLAVSKLKVPKLKVPKLALPKLSLGKKKTEVVVEEETTRSKPATAVEPTSRPRRTDLDMSASSSLLRRTDSPAKQPPPPTESRRDADLKFHLDLDDPIEDAPSIGPKKARRLEAIGVRTVADLLRSEPAQVARQLNSQHITPDTVRRWQAESTLVCRVPNLRGHDAQILVAAGTDEVEMLAAADADTLLMEVDAIIDTDEGERILRGNRRPDSAEVSAWIAQARQARRLQAA
jgi:hypothetical protein